MANQRWTMIAMPTAALEGDHLDDDRTAIKQGMSYIGSLSTGGASVFTKGPDVAFIENFGSIRQLIGLINSLLEPTDVLTTLEIHAHGNARICDGISERSVANDGMNLKSDIPKWDDNCFIYLSGCNTGTYDHIVEIPRRGPIAQRLANAMLFDSRKRGGGIYHHHLIVYGSRGFLSGSHFQGNTATTVDYTDSNGHHFHSYDTAQEVKRGHRDPNACYFAFKNGTW